MKKFLSIFFVSMFVFVGCAQKTSTTQTTTSEVPPAVSQETTGANVVTIKDFSFTPSVITVNKGDTVTWKHDDVATHTIVVPGLFESPNLERGASAAFKFDTVGTYEYHCGIHTMMKGTVVVK